MTQPSSDVPTRPMPLPREALPPASAPAPAPLPPANVAQMDPVALSKLFHENRNLFPPEQLAAYAGQLVAWWPDGSRIFDADVSYKALFQRLHDAGYADAFFMLEPIPLPGQPEIDPYNALCMAFAENRDNFPAEELLKYGGKSVAWWIDGTRIVDSDIDGVALVHRLRGNGYDTAYIHFETIPFPR